MLTQTPDAEGPNAPLGGGRFLHVTQRTPASKAVGDEGVTQCVRSDSFADSWGRGDS
jgi:hypothetical protein